MSHYPNHERQAFLDWIEADFPDVATVEENYEPREIPADEMLRRFVLPEGCTDVMPGHACTDVADYVGFDEDVRGMTYVIAASALLAERATDSAGADLLANLFETARP